MEIIAAIGGLILIGVLVAVHNMAVDRGRDPIAPMLLTLLPLGIIFVPLWLWLAGDTPKRRRDISKSGKNH